VLRASGEWTLETLRDALGPPDAALVALLLRAFSDETLAGYGSSVASERLLRATPTLVATTIQTLASLDDKSASLVHLPPEIFAAIVDEAEKVPALAAQVAAVTKKSAVSRSAWKVSHKTARRRAIAARDRIVRAVGAALGGPSQVETLKVAAGNADDDATLAQGLCDLADLLEQTLSTGTAIDRDALARFNIDGACVAQLRAAASALRVLGDAPTPPPYNALQRALDLQEGRVLALLDMVVGAMRSARASNKAIPLPELGPLQSWLIPPRGKRKSKGGGEGGASGADR
jgi:hypothetical protein